MTSTRVLALAFLVACRAHDALPPAELRVENDHLRVAVAADGRLIEFVNLQDGRNHSRLEPCARVRKSGKDFYPTAAAYKDGLLQLQFESAQAAIRVSPKKTYLLWEVVSLSGAVDEFVFLDFPLTLQGTPDEGFSACVLARNLKTNVAELPRPMARLTASSYARFGFEGSSAALIGCPTPKLRSVMQQVVEEAPELPRSPLGGPWALDAPAARGSYLFDFGNATEANIDQWIGLLGSLGFDQLDFHGGQSFRFGDCRLNPTLFPRGRASLKAVIDKLHASGKSAGLHTYAFFIDKQSEWVSPRPDPRLAKDASFTLAEDLSAIANTLSVAESTKGMSTVTGFFVWNSVTLQVDEELIVYGGVSPQGFTGCQRGAWGTKPAAHARGARVHHLKECFGLFVPDPETTLLEQVAARTADLYNECGFDMIYLDALDGEGILGGPEHGWHYGSKFVFELAKRLKRPALMEMSTFHHHLWFVRSRMGAWDHPRRSHKRFIDLHLAVNENYRKMFLPTNLGWWTTLNWQGSQTERTHFDDIEYLCAKALGTDSGLSLMGIDPWSPPASRRYVKLFRMYEDLRRRDVVPESIKKRLRASGEEFRLTVGPGGEWEFRPIRFDRRKLENGVHDWTARNPFGRQPARFRLEALSSAGPYDAPGNILLGDKSTGFTRREAAPGVTADLKDSEKEVKIGVRSMHLTGSNGSSSARGAWAKFERSFDPPLNLSAHQGMGVWVHGDGQSEVLNFQLRSPSPDVAAFGEHYVVVDFKGWRYVELIEPEGARFAEYGWPYGDLYSIYRESVNYARVGSLAIWVNQIPPGKSVSCYLSPIQALPLKSQVWARPELKIGGKSVVIPIELKTGMYWEGDALYAADGGLVAEVKPEGEMPILEPGDNRIQFAGSSVRALVTIVSEGPPLEKR